MSTASRFLTCQMEPIVKCKTPTKWETGFLVCSDAFHVVTNTSTTDSRQHAIQMVQHLQQTSEWPTAMIRNVVKVLDQDTQVDPWMAEYADDVWLYVVPVVNFDEMDYVGALQEAYGAATEDDLNRSRSSTPLLLLGLHKNLRMLRAVAVRFVTRPTDSFAS